MLWFFFFFFFFDFLIYILDRDFDPKSIDLIFVKVDMYVTL
jgi:hypothetical protein